MLLEKFIRTVDLASNLNSVFCYIALYSLSETLKFRGKLAAPSVFCSKMEVVGSFETLVQITYLHKGALVSP